MVSNKGNLFLQSTSLFVLETFKDKNLKRDFRLPTMMVVKY